MTHKTMYMHTLDKRPASYANWHGRPYIHFVGARTPAILATSLTQVRREQQAAIRQDWKDWNALSPENRGERPSLTRYGYVLVHAPERPE